MWDLIFLFLTFLNIWQFIYPFLIKFDIKFNIIKLKGKIKLTLFNKINFEFKIRIKNGYIYINHKNKNKKEKISNKNINILFFYHLFKQLYFREQYLDLSVKSNFGYLNDSSVTAVGSGYIDVLAKCFLSKIKNNKKLSHILVDVEPKYNEDIFNLRIINVVRISILDLIYTFIYTKILIWRNYEKNRNGKLKQRK